MTTLFVRLFQKKYWIPLLLLQFLFTGCAELDGVFPKFKSRNPAEETATPLLSTEIKEKQELIAEENRQLQQKITELQQQVVVLQNQQNKQQADFQLLQEQWEMNFVLLERSVEESLRSSKVSETTASMLSEVLDKQPQHDSGSTLTNTAQSSLPPVENYSLLKKTKTDIRKTPASTSTREMDKINNLDVRQQEITAEEEPGVVASGELNLQDLEDPKDLPDPELRALKTTAVTETIIAAETSEKTSKKGFADPDLNSPQDPLILIRHPGVKKIYNQGMTAVIQKNHAQAILVFENFTERFPDDLDSDNAFYWIGRSHFELQELEKAETAFRKVLKQYEHRPTSQGYKTPDAIYMLGKLQQLKNLEQRAAYYFEEVIRRFPGSAAARNAERDLGR
ncbi:MAG: tetratricopeptide repeat protein [SAR324 cluster bacterium]|nr:tetratricopeptide repeat protein [SAR324 cluster bacterium]MBL7036023.1 tetratricopeptide repeat protein [SAR324 cluster bacterium]